MQPSEAAWHGSAAALSSSFPTVPHKHHQHVHPKPIAPQHDTELDRRLVRLTTVYEHCLC